jgi:hypothetical protein
METRLPGWVLEQVLFRAEDEREDLHLIFRHRNGQDQLSLTIQGGQQGRDSTKVVSDFFCNSHSSGDTRDEWICEIREAIQQGVDPNARTVCAPGYATRMNGDSRSLDISEIKKPLPQR